MPENGKVGNTFDNVSDNAVDARGDHYFRHCKTCVMAKLPTPKFNLRLPNGESETLISLILRFNGKRLVYSTGYSIHPKDWDFKAQRPILRDHRPEFFTIRRALDDLSSYCVSIHLEQDFGNISPEGFKQLLDLKTGKTVLEVSEKPTFFEFLDMELQEMKDSKMRYESWKMFQKYVRKLKEFGYEVFGSKGFTYEDVDWNLRLKLIDWLTDKNDQLSYGNKTLKFLRQFLERARRKKLHSNIEYQGAGWTVSPTKAKGQIATLTVDELAYLADLKLGDHLAKIRDILLIGAGTGQRFGDFSKYKPENFYTTPSGIPLLSIISQKTDTPTKVPLNIFPWLIPVLERCDYTTPKISNQKLNDSLKVLCELAEFDEKILVVKQYMGRRPRVEKSYAEKYKVISTHTCRRSFATNLYKMGYRLSQIMPMTGHSTESQLRQYIGVDNEQNAEEIALDIMRRRQKEVSVKRNLRVLRS